MSRIFSGRLWRWSSWLDRSSSSSRACCGAPSRSWRCLVATKDQAYSLFLFSVPACMALWLGTSRFAREHWIEIARELAIGAALAATLLLAVDGALVNPSGFAARLRFLSGTASQDHAYYAKTWPGALLVLKDSFAHFTRYYPFAFAPLFVVGLGSACAGWTPREGPDTKSGPPGAVGSRFQSPEGARVAALLPLLFSVSYSVAFTLVARRTEHRFLLPQMLLMGVYGGFALDWVNGRVGARIGAWRGVLLVGLFGPALFQCVAVDVALLFDPRYDAERWLAEHVGPNDVIETYGTNVYLPRFSPSEHVIRVGPEPVDGRNPLPGVREVQDDYDAVARRRSKWIVISEPWVWRYLYTESQAQEPGRMTSREELRWERDTATCRFFSDLHKGGRGYRRAYTFRLGKRFLAARRHSCQHDARDSNLRA